METEEEEKIFSALNLSPKLEGMPQMQYDLEGLVEKVTSSAFFIEMSEDLSIVPTNDDQMRIYGEKAW